MPSRRWSGARNSSRREKTSFTGRPRGARERGDVGLEVELALGAEAAAEAAARSRGRCASGSSSVSGTPLRAENGTCVDDQIVTWSPYHWATIARGSIGTACDPSAT